MLIIAPESDLNNLVDIIAAADVPHANILHGQVTGREVLNRIEQGGFTRIHFGGHADRNSLLMSDGILNIDLVRQAIEQNGRVECVVLNGCDTYGQGAKIYFSGVDYVISWPGKVSDGAAGIFATTFWRSYNLGSSYSKSYDTAASGVIKFSDSDLVPILLNGRTKGYQKQIVDLLHRLDVSRTREKWYRVGIILMIVAQVLFNLVCLDLIPG